MNELTIKWLKREIDNGSFYVKTKLGNILVDHYDIDLPNFNGFQSDVKEIIERVPSYEELKAIKEENSNLKKLLRDCHYYMVSKNVIKQNSKQLDKEINEILTKIEEVLK